MRTIYPQQQETYTRGVADALLLALVAEDHALTQLLDEGPHHMTAAVWNLATARRDSVRALRATLEVCPSLHLTAAMAEKYWTDP